MGPISKRLHKNMSRLWRGSIRKFIETAIDNIEVDTGMSAASLQPLAAEVGLRSQIIEALRGFGPKRGHSNLDPPWDSNNAPFKSRALGERLGRGAYKVTFGTPNRVSLLFEFEIVVFQHYLHEFGLAEHTSGPWDSLLKGSEAMMNYFRDNLPENIPSITRFLIEGTLTDG